MGTEIISRPVISAMTAVPLEQEGLLSPVENKKRKISTAMISPASSRSSSEADYVEIPESLKSLETYEFLGFTRAAATSLWQRFLTYSTWMGADFFDYAQWHIEGIALPDATSELDDWNEVMINLGINDKLRTAILSPKFADIRSTASYKFWLLETMEMEWRALNALDNKIRTAQACHQHAKKVPKTGPISSLISPLPSQPSLISRKARLPTSGPPMEETQDKLIPEIATIPEVTMRIDRHTMIWRAGDREKHLDFYDESTGVINITAVFSFPSDFSRKPTAYFTPQKETADRYAQWTKYRASITDITILQIAVPWQWIENLSLEYLWFDNSPLSVYKWEKVVYHSRRGILLPKEIAYIARKDLLIGHIAAGPHKKYRDLDSYTQIKESDLVTIKINDEDKKAIQWIFQGDNALDGFEQQCRGKVWVRQLGTHYVPRDIDREPDTNIKDE